MKIVSNAFDETGLSHSTISIEAGGEINIVSNNDSGVHPYSILVDAGNQVSLSLHLSHDEANYLREVLNGC